MAVYVLLFALAILLAVPLVMKNPTPAKKTVYLAIMFVLLYLVSIFRYGIGNDYFSYIRIFRQIAETDFGGVFFLGFEPLFALLTKLITFVTDDPTILYAIYAALILAPIAWAIRKYSDNVWLSVVVYLCLTLFYNSLNFIRQSMAVSLLILAYGLMKEKKVVPVLILGICAALLHYTAAAFLPLYLLSLIRPTKKYLIIYGSVSVGVLAVCLIMKAAGANPLNLIAQVVTSITGKDYTGYVDTMYFNEGLGPEYLIMPFGLLAVVMISYFSGWKEKKEADLLLQLTFLNASIWSFILYAFIVERFSLFILIFSVFTLPSITEYFAEKARAVEKTETVNKKVPGYSKRKSEEKKDNSFLITVGITASLFVYNCWGMAKNFHGLFPYMWRFPAIQDAMNELDGSEENREALYRNRDLYTYLIDLKEADCGYLMISTGTEFGGFLSEIYDAAEYSGIPLQSLAAKPAAAGRALFYGCSSADINLDVPSGEAYGDCTLENGISVAFTDSGTAVVTDSEGKVGEVGSGKLAFVLYEADGSVFDAMWFDVSQVQRLANKVFFEDSSASEESAEP